MTTYLVNTTLEEVEQFIGRAALEAFGDVIQYRERRAAELIAQIAGLGKITVAR